MTGGTNLGEARERCTPGVVRFSEGLGFTELDGGDGLNKCTASCADRESTNASLDMDSVVIESFTENFRCLPVTCTSDGDVRVRLHGA